jgi:hypothetical protein
MNEKRERSARVETLMRVSEARRFGDSRGAGLTMSRALLSLSILRVFPGEGQSLWNACALGDRLEAYATLRFAPSLRVRHSEKQSSRCFQHVSLPHKFMTGPYAIPPFLAFFRAVYNDQG